MKQCNEKGFTLIELLMALAVFSVVVTLIVNARISQQNQSMSQHQAVDMQQTLRAALYVMADEIRMAGYDPTGKLAAQITTIGNPTSGGKFRFSYDNGEGDDGKDNDNANGIDDSAERKLAEREYKLSDYDGDGDTDITVNYDPAGSGTDKLVAENISAFTLTYFDKDNKVTATSGDVRSVQISITATTDQAQRNYLLANNTRTLTTVIKARNLGLN